VDDDLVFKALADSTRRKLLDLLYQQSGQNLTDLESHMDMTRFGVMKHLRILEGAGLVVSRKVGRSRVHFLNPVPIRQVYDRWIDKYTENEAAILTKLKQELEAG
jgi:DNA-binding transcriptional ArsR family regulator